MGHELVGRVEAVAPDVTRVSPGDSVVVEPNYSCGRCPLCREGNRNLCLSRTTIGINRDGGFAELVRVPAQCCWRAAADAKPDALLLAEPLAVVVRAVGRGEPKRGETAAVVGAGTLGLLALQVLRARGARVMVVSRSRRRFALAEELGAEATHATVEGPPDDLARRFSGREGVDLVVETAGTPEAVTLALELVRPGGRIVLTGLPHEPTSVSFFSVVRREVTLDWLDDLPGRISRSARARRPWRGQDRAAGHPPVRSRSDRRGVRRARGRQLHQGRSRALTPGPIAL